jgi:hypothetical protein
MKITERFSASKPCPVCDTGSKGCSVTDGKLVLCRGVSGGSTAPDGWRETTRKPDAAGFRHFLRKDEPSKARNSTRGQQRTNPRKDWPAEAERYAGIITDDLRADLAAGLGLPVESLKAVKNIGVISLLKPGTTFTFPECDTAEAVIGIVRRLPDGSKMAMKGAKRGLTLPTDWSEGPGPTFVVEGATDTISMRAAGLSVVGRPTNSGGVALLVKLFRSVGRDVFVLGENDKKENGEWPGRDGADAVARGLAEELRKPIRVAMPPNGAKDVRAWLTAEVRVGMPWAERGQVLQSLLLESAKVIEPPPEVTPGGSGPGQSDTDEEKRPPAAANVLIELGMAAELFHDKAGEAYATFEGKTAKVRSRPFRSWLTARYYEATAKGPHGEAMTTAIATLEASAVHGGPEHAVYVRLAGHDGAIYLHLADDDGTVIRIDAGGWRVDPKPPVRFLVTTNADALPMPKKGGRIEDLGRVVNCPDAESFALLAGWVSACFLPDGPFPLLVLTGEQGTAKSTTGRVLKQLIDPARVRDRAAPKDLRDLAIWASGTRLLCVDNVSSFPDWLSDGFCRLATGGGFGTRTLYENEEETLFEAKRPVIMNGIEDFVTRGDLLERSVILRHPPIPEHRRRLEADVWREFESLKPKLLGAMLDRVAAGLKSLPDVDKANMPRMADAAAFAIACERGMGEPARFLDAYRRNQSESYELTIADSAIAEPVRFLVTNAGGSWSGTPSELYAATKPAGDKLPHGWPKRPSDFSGKLRRISPALAKCYGLTVTSDRATTSDRTRIIRLDLPPENSRNPPSAASGSSGEARSTESAWTTPDGPDDASRKLSGTDLTALFK